MVVERRVFSRLPCYLQTDQNDRSTYIADDVMFEPERAGFVNGYIGDTSVLTEKDLERLPPIFESDAARQKYQLSLGAVLVDPDTEVRSGGAFYPDLVGQISANGGLVDDPNRLFETPFYAWSPPIDYDKHINFTRYYWTGPGNAQANGEYVTKEPQGSQTILFEVTGTGFVSREATISISSPASPNVGDLWEDASDLSRTIFVWNGTAWVGVPFFVEDKLPTATTGYVVGDYVYVRRTGPEFNRPLVWRYTEDAGRWVAHPVVVGPRPDNPSEGMVWEDTTLAPARSLKVYRNGAFTNLAWTGVSAPSGVPSGDSYVYDARQIRNIQDGWSAMNWWRHFDDLAPADREALQPGDQAVRPMIEFWAGLERAPNDTRDFRNERPRFEIYTYDFANDAVVQTGSRNSIFQYQIGEGMDDQVLGFPVRFNQTGEFLFELTLETGTDNDFTFNAPGYRYFRDAFTGLSHSVWAKAKGLTRQTVDANGLADVPVNISANSDHDILSVASRSRMLNHMASVIKTQVGFEGNEFGLNNYRWSIKDRTEGATMIDCENTLLRTLATLQRPDLSIPDVIRRVARDYNRLMVKFVNRLNQRWDKLDISDPADNLLVTPEQAANAILTDLFIGRNEDFPYWFSDMGRYTETQISGGMAATIGVGDRPIMVPPSPSRTGSAPTYRPGTFTERDGTKMLRGHDGTLIRSFGDDRDLVWLNLQQRFYDAVPPYYRDETATFSARHTTSNFFLSDFYGNSTPNTTTRDVKDVVSDATAVPSPTAGDVYFDTGRGALAYYDGSKFLFSGVQVDDVFKNTTSGEFYIYNGFGTFEINRFERPFDFDYSTQEFRQILRREFERWAVFQDVDFVANNDFDENDPFTWNYRSAGLEGNYRGIYQRMYNTPRPHVTPWEVVGYFAEPEWWQTQYVPSSIAPDGTPRYANTHPMWTDFQAGTYDPLNGRSDNQFVMSGPIPVDAQGELRDPVALGIVPIDNLVPERRDDSWVYGDGAPVEQDFRNSANYTFAVSLLGYLMKPGFYTDTVWSELYIDVGTAGANPLWRGPHVVHRDTLKRPRVNDLPVHLEVRDGKTEQRIGINAWISEYARILGNNVTDTFGRTIRNTQISPGWRTSGFINPDRTVLQTLSGIKIPFEDVHTILHRSPPTRESFGSGVLVTREGTGYRVFGFDLFNPAFEIDVPVAPIAGGQVELRESFTATAGQHRFTTTTFRLPKNVQANETAKLGVLVNGLLIKPQHITIVDDNTFEIESIVTINAGDEVTATTVTTQSNPSTRVKQFQIEGVSFPYIDAGQGITERVEYGRFFDTAPDVINFMLGYGRKLTENGWLFEDEASPGVLRDWLFGAKQFAAWVLQTSSVWQQDGPQDLGDFFFSPFRGSAKFRSPFGQVLNVEALQNGAYGIIDRNAEPIDPERVFTSRIGNTLTLTPDDDAPEMFGIRVLVAEDQHVVFLSNITKFNDLIYDPVIALFQSTLRTEAYRSEGWAGRLEADGFIINQGDLLPNFEKQAKDITRFYDRIDTLDDPVKRDQARELYGWYPNDVYVDAEGDKTPMMDAIGAEERSRFDYHRGMVHTKGTIRPLIAFSRGTCLGRDNVVVYEDWAWRWCEFGDTRRDVVRFRVDKNDYREQLQIIEFNQPENALDFVIQVPEFNRQTPDEGRWIIPPIVGDTDCCPYTFPINNGVFNAEQTRMFVKLFDATTNLTAISLFHYDPVNGLYDPAATCEIDYIGHLDPARYTDGNGSEYSDGQQWGEEQVGQMWWDQSRLEYMDYRSLLPAYNDVARDWGRLKYFNVTLVPSFETGTVETFDPYTKMATPHGLTTGDSIQITGAQPEQWNGEYTVTVTSPTTFEIFILDALDAPATGEPQVQVAFVDIYEWVKSPVRPSGWNDYIRSLSAAGSVNGQPIDGDDTSYVTGVSVDDRGNRREHYFFWIRGNTGDNPIKDTRADLITRRLENPTQFNTAWFGIIDSNHMITFVDGERVRDNYGFEIIRDETELDYHTEWLLISENDQFNDVPAIVRNKLIDSLSGMNQQDDPVPSPLLSETERFGSQEFPPQTVFRDRAAALKVFTTAVNTILNRRNLNTQPNLTGLFPLSAEGTYWNRAEHRVQEFEDKPVFDTVATEAIRSDRLAQERYFANDLVKVEQSGNNDLWTGNQTDSTYVLRDGAFIEVGVNNATLNIVLDENTTPAVIRSTFNKVYGLFTKQEQNSVIFSVLYEMLRQSPDADWFMKTSYVTTQIFDTVSQTPFVRPNEVEAVIANLLDLKPYRTKLRSSTFTYTVGQIEEFGIQIDEFPDQKITLSFDRLNCALEDDAGWDIFAWDSEIAGWDKPIWDWADLGRAEFFSLGVKTADAATTAYVFETPYDPTLYNHNLIVRQNGNVVNLADNAITATISKTHTVVTVTLSAPLDPTYTLELQQSGGFYQGSTPNLGPEFDNTLFQAAPSTYKHHVARMMELGIQAPFPSMDDCYATPPRSPEERIPNNVEDCVTICVQTDWTTAYRGWDTTPWDSTPWDEAPSNIGSRVFFISAGAENIIPAGLSVIATSQTVASTDPRFVVAPSNFDIVRVDGPNGTFVEGTDFRFLPDAPWVVEFLPLADLEFTGNGIATTFDVSSATNGIVDVYKNNVIQTSGVDYNLVGNTIEFIQPAPTVVPVFGFTRGRHYEGNAIGTDFPTGLAGNSLAAANSFVFQNGVLVNGSDYTVDQSDGSIVFNTAPATDDDIILFSLGNDVADDSVRFPATTFTGNGTTTAYNVADANDITAWVFVNGLYQSLGDDYTIPAYGTVEFATAPANGAAIEIRVLDPNGFVTYDQEHIVFTASGGASDPIPGLNDADPDRMVVFVGDQIQNAYSPITTDFTLSNGSPDVINWDSAPAAGTTITVRVIRSVTISESTLINVNPIIGDQIRVTQQPVMEVGDNITFFYNRFPVGPLGSFRVNSVPTDYDVVDGELVMDNPVLNGFINLTYEKSRRTPNPTAILVRMTNVVDLTSPDHLAFDPTLGFEDNRRIGLRILNSTNQNIYIWDGSNWIDQGVTIAPTDQVLVLQDHQIVEFDGTNFNVVFNTGDNFSTPPVLPYPLNGTGITSGTYSLGQTANAAVDFPEAYQINQHPGGC